MSRAIEIIDPESERRLKIQRRILILGCVLSLALFGYPEARYYYTKWKTLKAARELSLYLLRMKTNAILRKAPLEAKFSLPGLIEVYESSSCGPFAEKTRVATMKLADLMPGIEFVPEPWVRESLGSKEPYLRRFCYDPLYGSSVFADGLVHGSVFLAHRDDLDSRRGEHVVHLVVEGASGDISVQ